MHISRHCKDLTSRNNWLKFATYIYAHMINDFLLHNVIVHNADGVSFVKKQVTNVFPTNISMSAKLNESNLFS